MRAQWGHMGMCRSANWRQSLARKCIPAACSLEAIDRHHSQLVYRLRLTRERKRKPGGNPLPLWWHIDDFPLSAPSGCLYRVHLLTRCVPAAEQGPCDLHAMAKHRPSRPWRQLRTAVKVASQFRRVFVEPKGDALFAAQEKEVGLPYRLQGSAALNWEETPAVRSWLINNLVWGDDVNVL